MRDIFFLTCGSFAVPAMFIEPRAALPPLRSVMRGLTPRVAMSTMTNTVGVAVRDDGNVVLVDAGWSLDACGEPARVIGRVHSTMLGMRTRPADAIVEQLADLGIERRRVRTIVATHMHLDHVGGADDFPNAEVVSSDVELSAFRTLGVRSGYRTGDLARSGRLHPIHVNGAPTYGFPASHDLFGDGEVVLLDAHGHTPGSLAVALRGRTKAGGSRAPDHCYVHIGDAAYRSWEYGLSPSGPSLVARATAWRMDLQRETYKAIRACEVDPRRPVIVPSHDDTVFERLPHAPSEAASAA